LSLATELLGDEPLQAALQIQIEPDATIILVVDALAGNVPAARRLLQDLWPRIIQKILLLVNEQDLMEEDQVALEAHLVKLPVLATVYERPSEALAQWAIVGVREILGRPVSYPRARPVSPSVFWDFERALLCAQTTELDDARLVKSVLDVSYDEIGRWLGVSGSAVSAWARGVSEPRPAVALRLREIADFAATMDENLRPDRIAPLFAASPVPALGGRTYKQAFDDGETPAFCTDVLRRGVGLPPRTVRGWAWLTGLPEESARTLATDEIVEPAPAPTPAPSGRRVGRSKRKLEGLRARKR
jgi:DNA-binding transcriptional regulator YiaG